MTYGYDPASELTSTVNPDGVTARATYDAAGRLAEIANTESSGTLSRFTYALDAAGNRTEQTTSVGTTYYSYDALNRLLTSCTGGSCVPPGAQPLACLACTPGAIARPAATTSPNPSDTLTSFTYDPVGNRLTQGTYQGTTTYTYDAADRLTQAAGPGGTTAYGYDANGNEGETTRSGMSIRTGWSRIDVGTDTGAPDRPDRRIDAQEAPDAGIVLAGAQAGGGRGTGSCPGAQVAGTVALVGLAFIEAGLGFTTVSFGPAIHAAPSVQALDLALIAGTFGSFGAILYYNNNPCLDDRGADASTGGSAR